MTGDLLLRTALAELGGVARTAQLRRSVSARAIRDAVLQGLASRMVDEASTGKTQVTLRPGAHPSAGAQRGIRVFWRSIPAESIVDGVTEPYRAVLDCVRDLPFDQSLAVSDSALRCGHIDRGELRQLAAVSSGSGARAVGRVAQECELGAANPLESVLRAICCDVVGLQVKTQVQTADPWARVDLCDTRIQLVIEAGGFETHATRDGFDKDCARYTAVALCQIRQSVPSGRRVSRKPIDSAR